MRRGCFVALAFAAANAASVAQTTVYESKDQAGPVYSDKPAPGAAVVELPPLNVVEVAPIVPPRPPLVAAAPPYRSLLIVSPANDDTVRFASGAIEVVARPNPALRQGDRIRVKIDGRVLLARFAVPRLRIDAAAWSGAARDDNTEHSLQLAIEDKQGALLIESAPIRLYAQRATVSPPRR